MDYPNIYYNNKPSKIKMTSYKTVFVKTQVILGLFFILFFSRVNAQSIAEEAKMKSFVRELMSKMTLDEKIGQLNLVTGGTPTTGSVVNKDIEISIQNGNIGGIFGVFGAEKVKQVQSSKDLNKTS
jgi:beta-glucosidase